MSEPVSASPSVTPPANERGGVLVRLDGQMYFLPQENVLRIVPRPPIERVPGSPPELLGVALDAGVVLPVIGLGDLAQQAGPLVVCRLGGELLALSGLAIVASGRFPAGADDAPASVRHDDRVIEAFDLDAAATCVVPGPWAGASVA